MDLPGGQVMQPFLSQIRLDVSHSYVIATLRIPSPWGGDVPRAESKESRSSQHVVLENVGSGDSRSSLGLEPKGEREKKQADRLGNWPVLAWHHACCQERSVLGHSQS